MVDTRAESRRRPRPSATASARASTAKRALLDDRPRRSGRRGSPTLVVDACGAANKVLFFGNGGSAADATHLAAEFVGRYVLTASRSTRSR